MTYEEAIKELKQIPSHIGGDCDGYEKRAIRIAIEALEKQMPKKPAKQWGNYVCPNCRTDTQCRIVMGWEKHCPGCGQAIDWSDAE